MSSKTLADVVVLQGWRGQPLTPNITAKGNERKKIFLSCRDYEKFLSYLTDGVRKFGMGKHKGMLVLKQLVDRREGATEK